MLVLLPSHVDVLEVMLHAFIREHVEQFDGGIERGLALRGRALPKRCGE